MSFTSSVEPNPLLMRMCTMTLELSLGESDGTAGRFETESSETASHEWPGDSL